MSRDVIGDYLKQAHDLEHSGRIGPEWRLVFYLMSALVYAILEVAMAVRREETK